MGILGRPCIVCGRKTGGKSRCEQCQTRKGRHQRSCREPGCTVRTWSDWCPDHQPMLAGQSSDEAARLAAQPWRRAYRDPAYHRERSAALRRARGRCEHCRRPKGAVCTAHGEPIRLQTDHVISLSRGGINHHRGNLAVLCHCCCHEHKTRTGRLP